VNDDEANVGELLLGLEEELLKPEVRRDRNRVLALLSEDFEEFGASGRAWTRDEIAGLLATESYTPPEIEDFRCRMLAPGVTLVTYRTIRRDAETGSAKAANRSSIWKHENGVWRVVFHQGTPTAESRVPD
jgi:hypothetical protein